MAEHLVTCEECGKGFDANKGGYYNAEEHRYLCMKCGKRHKVDMRNALTDMHQTTGGMIAKVAFGLMFVAVAFDMDDIPGLMVGLVLGLALVAWGLIPLFAASKSTTYASSKGFDAIEPKYDYARKCTNCGATSMGDVCEYCGAPLE